MVSSIAESICLCMDGRVTAKACTSLERNREGMDVLQRNMVSMPSTCVTDHVTLFKMVFLIVVDR